jgi:hypothetical protein
VIPTTCVYNSSEHKSYDAGNRHVFTSDEIISMHACTYTVCTSCPPAGTQKVLLHIKTGDTKTQYSVL